MPRRFLGGGVKREAGENPALARNRNRGRKPLGPGVSEFLGRQATGALQPWEGAASRTIRKPGYRPGGPKRERSFEANCSVPESERVFPGRGPGTSPPRELPLEAPSFEKKLCEGGRLMMRRLIQYLLGVFGVSCICWVWLGLGFVLPVRAQATAEEKAEVVVTATRVETDVRHLPDSVTIITREEIERREVQGLYQALENYPSISIKHNGWLGQWSYLRLRGGKKPGYSRAF